jgi:peroxiredoxin
VTKDSVRAAIEHFNKSFENVPMYGTAFEELCKLLANASVECDNDGQIVIYTDVVVENWDVPQSQTSE